MDTRGHGTDPLHLAGLELTSIVKGYCGLPVIRDLSLAIPKGEMFCLLGPSGCGKSTVLKIVAGLLEADEGRVFLAGRDITHVPPQRRGVALVFQNYALFPHLSVFENVAYGLRRRGVSGYSLSRQVDQMLEFVRLADYGRRRVHELSGGEQQRVALARALVIQPQVLLLDEPLSNLDARLRTEIRREIRRVQRELALTAVYVTHDQEEAMSLADRIGVMNNGRIEQIGSPKEIYEDPATRFVADFIGRTNFFEGVIENGNLFAMGRRMAAPVSGWPHGIRVTCAVRQERIRMGNQGNGSATAVVHEAVYFGSVVRYQLIIDGTCGSQELTAEVPVSQAVFQVGDTVGLEIRPEDIRVIAQ